MRTIIKLGGYGSNGLWVLLHGFAGNGFLHPLTGLDHMLAMLAVGAWSAQLGGRRLFHVPLAFLVMMCIGGALGISALPLPYSETGIVLSVIFLGAAIALNQKTGWMLAGVAVGLFGLCHGYAHGRELPMQQHIPFYIFGFLITTVGLHLVGAVSGLLLLEYREGNRYLRRAGGLVFLVGLYLLCRAG